MIFSSMVENIIIWIGCAFGKCNFGSNHKGPVIPYANHIVRKFNLYIRTTRILVLPLASSFLSIFNIYNHPKIKIFQNIWPPSIHNQWMMHILTKLTFNFSWKKLKYEKKQIILWVIIVGKRYEEGIFLCRLDFIVSPSDSP